ncbi:hypothetical protein BASA50_008276 [Batrachochytrium salamandrivorans]|uniref:Tyrosine specific protein phosphatases domain-containing protein n=1 Tax=Batrachochytrium salamandrivorans TaxID=1357716 RepID=A0ABQ8F7X7_9FUNG|nr:hypothetical protein BASA50_008276 [Batrachochytrium salamandrivorans]
MSSLPTPGGEGGRSSKFNPAATEPTATASIATVASTTDDDGKRSRTDAAVNTHDASNVASSSTAAKPVISASEHGCTTTTPLASVPIDISSSIGSDPLHPSILDNTDEINTPTPIMGHADLSRQSSILSSFPRRPSSTVSISTTTTTGTPDIANATPLLPALRSMYGSPSTTALSSTSQSGRRRRIPGIKPTQFHSPKELLMSVQNVVKTRTGSVLARQIILKSDHFDMGLHSRLDFHLQGAPNFRMADMGVFGVAQPTVPGITTVLTLLGCHPSGPSVHPTTWFSTREEPMIYLNRKPFVIRDAGKPTKNIKTYHGISASRLEQVEARLKEDILREEARWSGLFLVHEEASGGSVFPSWMAIETLQTPREVFEDMVEDGFRVIYIRIPIGPEQAPDDRYIDEYVQVIRNTPIDSNLVFNCGMGVGRTTFAMVLAMLLRRGQTITNTSKDPFLDSSGVDPESSRSHDEIQLSRGLEEHNRAILRIVDIVDKTLSLQKLSSQSSIEWAISRGALIDDLKASILGNYYCIQQLTIVLADGSDAKRALDQAINRCDVLTNLRENILVNRLLYSTTTDSSYLQKAFGCLERYFLLLAFCSYVNKQLTKGYRISFSEWLKSRQEIWNMIENFRSDSSSLSIFRPIDDLSAFSQDTLHANSLVGWGPNKQPAVRELDKHVIRSRKGIVLGPQTILKEDSWSKDELSSSKIEGARNFRKIRGLPVYAVAQPTLQGIKSVIQSLKQPTQRIVWINLREEPLVYINGNPYVLRDQYLTLRNIKSYSGITGSRLEMIEEKLKEDVGDELIRYNGKVLLHTETHGTINPIWQDCKYESVMTLQEAMNGLRKDEGSLQNQVPTLSQEIPQQPGSSRESVNSNSDGKQVETAALTYSNIQNDILYFRVPVTAETPPDASDFDHIVHLLSRYSGQSSSIIMNCQVGLGRSTTGTVVASLVLRWLHRSTEIDTDTPSGSDFPRKPLLNYRPIHSLLRVIRNGVECKRIVDDAIDNCAHYINLRDVIEESRQVAEAEMDGIQKAALFVRGVLHLRRYFTLILFQSYLDSNEPGVEMMLATFQDWLQKHPEFSTISEELETNGVDLLTPVEEIAPGDGIALSSEVVDVVNRRDGGVLAQGTIIKYDLFPGAQKLSLPDRIDGAVNFRRISLAAVRELVGMSNLDEPCPDKLSSCDSNSRLCSYSSSVYGVGMPTKEGIRCLLKLANASSDGNRVLFWTSLREEPVIYVNGRPYVLRLFHDPLKNLEATGITRERVELMENQMKGEIIRDVRRYNGKLLLHDERVEGNGQFTVVPVWESVREEDIETPSDVYAHIKSEGYRVDYLRIPVTDEQAPIPDVFDQLMERLLGISKNGDAIFNCQMGRGRTTTGIVTACLIQMTVGHSSLLEDQTHHHLHPMEDDEQSSSDLDIATRLRDSEVDIRQRFQLGEYKIVMQLIAVLQYGKLAKLLTDKAIDMSDQMQNLRIAIYEYRLRILAAEAGSRKYRSLAEVGFNYLIRYFYLIVFADYLIEVWTTWSPDDALCCDYGDLWSPQTGGLSTHHHSDDLGQSHVKPARPIKFSAWLSERKEILNIIRKSDQMLE